MATSYTRVAKPTASFSKNLKSVNSYLLLQTGGYLLLQTGGKIIIRDKPVDDFTLTAKPTATFTKVAKPA